MAEIPTCGKVLSRKVEMLKSLAFSSTDKGLATAQILSTVLTRSRLVQWRAWCFQCCILREATFHKRPILDSTLQSEMEQIFFSPHLDIYSAHPDLKQLHLIPLDLRLVTSHVVIFLPCSQHNRVRTDLNCTSVKGICLMNVNDIQPWAYSDGWIFSINGTRSQKIINPTWVFMSAGKDQVLQMERLCCFQGSEEVGKVQLGSVNWWQNYPWTKWLLFTFHGCDAGLLKEGVGEIYEEGRNNTEATHMQSCCFLHENEIDLFQINNLVSRNHLLPFVADYQFITPVVSQVPTSQRRPNSFYKRVNEKEGINTTQLKQLFVTEILNEAQTIDQVLISQSLVILILLMREVSTKSICGWSNKMSRCDTDRESFTWETHLGLHSDIWKDEKRYSDQRRQSSSSEVLEFWCPTGGIPKPGYQRSSLFHDYLSF